MSDGIRTHDDRDHNPGLYQLSYAHHLLSYLTEIRDLVATAMVSRLNWRARQDSNLQPSA